MTADRGRILALDVGDARIGLALSDPLGVTAQPIGTLRRTRPDDDLSQLRDLVQEHQVRRVVVGLPLLLSGEEGEQARRSRAFAERLAEHAGVPVDLWDERLTSAEAERVMLAGNARRDRRRRSRDTLSAVLILQSYLQAAGPHPAGLPG